MPIWTWLTEPLPLDAANTYRWADDTNVEFLDDPTDLEARLDVVRPRLPRHRLDLPGSFDQQDLKTSEDSGTCSSISSVHRVRAELRQPQRCNNLPAPA